MFENEFIPTKFWNQNYLNIENKKEEIPINFFNNHLKSNIISNLEISITSSKNDKALLNFLLQSQVQDIEAIKKLAEQKQLNKIKKYPNSFQRKRTGIIIKEEDQLKLYELGNADVILNSCNRLHTFNDEIIDINEEKQKEYKNIIKEMQVEGLQVLLFAYKNIKENESRAFYLLILIQDLGKKITPFEYQIESSDLILLGFLGIKQPIKPELESQIQECQAGGIKIRLVTTENKRQAISLARKYKLIHKDNENQALVLTGKKFQQLTGGIVCQKCRIPFCNCPLITRKAILANEKEFQLIVNQLAVLCDCNANDKLTLTTGLQQLGNLVAVTGDSLSDTLAMQCSTVSFSFNSCISSSSILHLNNNFSSIINSLIWGRNLIDYLNKYLAFQLTICLSLLIIVLISVSVLREPVISPVQMLWIHLIMDSLAGLALASDKPEKNVMIKKPWKQNTPLITFVFLLQIMIIFEQKMKKHIMMQTIYQVTIMLICIFAGHQFIPEYENDQEEKSIYNQEAKYYLGKYVRNGRRYQLSSDELDYGLFENEFGPSRHFTFCFNLFVLLQFWNLFSCRKANDEANIFQGCCDNILFFFILCLMVLAQALFVEFGGRAFDCSFQGLHHKQWLIAVGFAGIGWVLNLILKCINEEKILLSVKRAKFKRLLKKRLYNIEKPQQSENEALIPKTN